VAALSLYLMVSICRFGSCYLHQNGLTGCSLYDSHNIVFVSAVLVAVILFYLQLDQSIILPSLG
jgi:hypothetical protein